MHQLTIRPYQPDAIPALLALTQTTLGNAGAVRKTATFWQWKHQHNPFGQSFGVYTWDEERQIATGLRVLLRWQFCAPNGRIYHAVRAVDTATHPDYQRRGIFSILTRQAIADLTIEGVDFIYNTPNQKSLPGYLKMGWQVVASWPLYIKVLRPLRMLFKRLHRTPADGTPKFGDYFGAGIMNWMDFIQSYGEQLAQFMSRWEAQRGHAGIRTRRTPSYLDWRYGQHPHIQYGVYTEADATGQLLGFAILRPNLRYGWQESVLAELLLGEQTITFGAQFLHRLRKQLQSDYLIAHASPRTLEYQLLRRVGFLRAPRRGMIFTTRPLQDAMAAINQPANWDLTLGDLEIF